MNLKDLENLQQQASKVKQQRHHQADAQYDQAMALYKQAKASDFEDKIALKQAIKLLHAVHQNNRRNPKPLVMLGYLLYLMDQEQDAALYLHNALRLKPEDPEILALLDLIGKDLDQLEQAQGAMPAAPTASVQPDTQAQAADDDLDALYDEIEGQIQEKLNLISHPRYGELAPSCEPDGYKPLRQLQKALTQFIEGLAEPFALLEDEFDMVELHTQLQPLESRTRQLEYMVATSKEMLGLHKSMEEEYAGYKHLTDQCKTGGGVPSDAELDSIFDRCDQFADAIDGWEEQGIQVGTLVTQYQKLSKQLEKLQDAVDEQLGA